MLAPLHLPALLISWGLVVLIWIIQLVHYPSFHYIDAAKFIDFHNHHSKSITVIVMPLMLAELIISFYLGYKSGFAPIESIALLIVIGIWLSTFIIQIPLHDQLSVGNNTTVVNKLVTTNWIRTFLWSAKAILLTWGWTSLD